MKLEYDADGQPDDEVAYHAAREELLDRLEAWLTSAPAGQPIGEPGRIASDAGIALEWKRWYADGHLARWTLADVEELLFEWCPRKVAGPDGALNIAHSVVALATFLDAHGLLARGSAPPAQVATFVVERAGDLIEAMMDPADVRPAKTFVADGFLDDPDDPDDGVDRDDDLFGPFGSLEMTGYGELDPKLPPIVMPPDDEVAAAKAGAIAVGQLAALAAYLDGGRPLTAKGHLRLADARTLVDLLGTGDVVDRVIGDVAFRTTTSAHLVRLHQLFQWAKEARFVRVAKGKAIATKKGLAIDRDRAAAFDEAFDALLELGPLGSQRNPTAWLAWPDVVDLIDEEIPGLLLGIYSSPFPVPLTDLVDLATDLVLDAFMFDSPTGYEHLPGRLTRDLRDVFDVFARAGVVRWIELAATDGGLDADPDASEVSYPTADDVAELDHQITLRLVTDHDDDHDETGAVAADEADTATATATTGQPQPLSTVPAEANATPERPDGQDATGPIDPRRVEPASLAVELTPAGIDAVRRLAVSMGLDAPVAGRFAERTASEMLEATDVEDFAVFAAEGHAWRQRRTPDEAITELAEAVVELDDAALKNLALAMMTDIDASLAEAHVRRLTAEPACAGFARCWLVDQGFADPSTLYDPADPSAFVDVLADRMMTGGPDALVASLDLVGDQRAQLAFLDAVWRSPSRVTTVVLVAIGQVHPTKQVAKAARKASFKRQSAAIDQT